MSEEICGRADKTEEVAVKAVAPCKTIASRASKLGQEAGPSVL